MCGPFGGLRLRILRGRMLSRSVRILSCLIFRPDMFWAREQIDLVQAMCSSLHCECPLPKQIQLPPTRRHQQPDRRLTATEPSSILYQDHTSYERDLFARCRSESCKNIFGACRDWRPRSRLGEFPGRFCTCHSGVARKCVSFG